MGEWFEKNNIDPDELEIAEGVTVAKDLTVALEVAVFSVTGSGTSAAANAPSTVEGDREQDLTPVAN